MNQRSGRGSFASGVIIYPTRRGQYYEDSGIVSWPPCRLRDRYNSSDSASGSILDRCKAGGGNPHLVLRNNFRNSCAFVASTLILPSRLKTDAVAFILSRRLDQVGPGVNGVLRK